MKSRHFRSARFDGFTTAWLIFHHIKVDFSPPLDSVSTTAVVNLPRVVVVVSRCQRDIRSHPLSPHHFRAQFAGVSAVAMWVTVHFEDLFDGSFEGSGEAEGEG